MIDYDFSLEPGKDLNVKKYSNNKPIISVIIPFYNDFKYIEQSVKCILNQSYPYYEIIIVDDGSTDKESLIKLEEVSKLDFRIKVYHKENEGLAATRDYGASKSSKNSKFLFFLDSDDLVEKTFLECAYLTLETNIGASWVYSDSCGFDGYTYLWNYWFDSDKLQKVNDLESANFIRKDTFFAVGGYGLKEKAVNEDWNFWLKQIANNYYPVHMSFYGKWYRRKDSGELKKANQNKTRSLEIISETKKNIKGRVEAIQYPLLFNNKISNLNVVIPKYEGKKKSILLLISNLSDKYSYVLDFVKEIDKDKFNILVVSNEPNKNQLRQLFEKYAFVYDLSTFLSNDYWLSFVKYLIVKENINILYIESEFAKSIVACLNSEFNLSYVEINTNGSFDKKSVDIDENMNINKYFEKFNDKYKEMVFDYQKEIYGKRLIDVSGNNIYNYKKQLLRERLWNFSLWRRIVNSSLWKKIKKITMK